MIQKEALFFINKKIKLICFYKVEVHAIVIMSNIVYLFHSTKA